MKKILSVLTIAGSDCSGGAGIQADIKTITVHGLYASSVITALTAQNTTGVFNILKISADFIGQQIDCVFNDIRPEAVKIGMLGEAEIIKTISERLIRYDAKNIVVDPVMISTSGDRLLPENAAVALSEKLFPLARIITPNIPEAETLCGFSIKDENGMEKAAKEISRKFPGAVIIKGGHFSNSANDLLLENNKFYWYRSERIDTQNTHGTGCTLSSAIACDLALGYNLQESVRRSKEFVTGALSDELDIGTGNGPVNHMFNQVKI